MTTESSCVRACCSCVARDHPLACRLSAIRDVSEVTELEGTASVISMRGKVKHPFEYKFGLKWATGDGSTGVLKYTDVSPLAMGGDAGQVSYDLDDKVTSQAATETSEKVKAAVEDIKLKVDMTLMKFLSDLKAR